MKNWQIKKLGEVCLVEYGTRVVMRKDGGSVYPVYGGGGATFFMDTFNRENRVVVARFAMSEQCTRFVSGKFFLNDSGLTISSKNKKELSQDFLDYQVVALNDLFYSLARGSAQKNLNLPAFRNLNITYPNSIWEQQRIVKILDEAFEAIEKAKENVERNLRNAEKLFEFYLENSLVDAGNDWGEKMLETVCDIQSKLIDPRKSEFLDLTHVGAGNIEAKSGNLIGLKTSREEKLISGKFQFDQSMILYSKIRPYLMKVVRPDFSGLCSADIYPLMPREDLITRDYLFYLLLSTKFTEFAIKGSARAGMPKVNREHLFSFQFSLPPIPEQRAIVARLDSLSAETKKLEAIYQRKLSCLEELKKSLLQKAFAGEL